MAAKLTALDSGPAYNPVVYRCACGCGAYACRGFPNDVWYTAAHVPPTMRFPWERGYEAPPVEVPTSSPAATPAAPFLPGLSPA